MVGRREIETGPHPHVRIERVQQDLHVLGHDEGSLLVEADAEGALDLDQEDELVTIQARRSLSLTLPRGATLEIGQVGGELQIEGLKGEIHLGKIGGDASLDACGRVVADRVGGDLLGRQLGSGVSLKAVGGDVLLRHLRGGVKVLGAGGDLSVRGLSGPIEAAMGGDAHVVLDEPLDGAIRLSAGGDVYCRLPGGASAGVELSAGGDLTVDAPDEFETEWGRASFRLGEGEHEIRIDTGGDLWLGVGEEAEAEFDLDSLGTMLASKVGEKIAEMETALTAMGAEMGAVSSDRIAQRVQRIVDRAVGVRARSGPPRELREALDGLASGSRAEPVSEEEKLKVLRLLEQNKISVAEAEMLLEALER